MPECVVEECEAVSPGRMCSKHRGRLARHGDVAAVRRIFGDDLRRWWSYVRPEPNGCWAWTGATNDHGYGVFTVGGRQRRAHRWFHEQLNGPISPGLVGDHLCHNADESCSGGPSCPHRRCVNPAHLEPVTDETNFARGRQRWPIRNNGLAARESRG